MLSDKELVLLRLINSGVINKFSNCTDCSIELFGIQSQVQQFGEISFFNRVQNLTKEILNAEYQSNNIIKIWGQRMTVHMYNHQDWKLINMIYSFRNNYIKKGWEGKEDTLNKVLRELEDYLVRHKMISKKEILGIIEQNASHINDPYRDNSIIMKSTLDGLIYGVPKMPHTELYGHRNKCAPDWIPCFNEEEYQDYLETLIKRYFSAYGPATFADFLHWSGLTKKEVHDSFIKVSSKFSVIEKNGKSLYYLGNPDKGIMNMEDLIPGNVEESKVIMLGKFDPLLVAYSDKTWIATSEQQKAVWRPAGQVEAVLVIDNQLAGTWRYSPNGKKLDFNFSTFRRLSAKEKKLVGNEANKIALFIGRETGVVKFEDFRI